MKTVILAGGKGTRMGALTRQIPKPMIPVAGKPILEHQIELARRYGCKEVMFLTGYLGHVIADYFGDGSQFGVQLRYRCEETPQGTAGALKAIESWLDDDFLVFYADIMMDVDLGALMESHRQRRARATLVVHPNNHPDDSDLLELDVTGRVVAFHPKPHSADRYYHNLVNAALYVLSPSLLRQIPAGQFADLGRDVFPACVRSGDALFGYNTSEYIRDMGTVERLEKIQVDVLSGKVGRLNHRHARRAVFLDRDGVLTEDRGHLKTAEELCLLPGAADAVRRINQSESLAVLVTNQPTVAKGFTTEQELDRTHARLETLLGAEHAYLDRIYCCPHHPEKGFPGERPEYKIPCACRKPAPGMLLQAAEELNIDLANSVMIGDRTSDVQAGRNAGTRTILVRTGAGGSDGKLACGPDVVCGDVSQAVMLALNERQWAKAA